MTDAGPVDALDAALAIGDALEGAGIPHAIGGALAYGVWGVPRGTVDVDVNLFVADDELPRVAATLTALGIGADPDAFRRASEREGVYFATWGTLRIDLFTPSIPFSWEAGRTRVRWTIDDRALWVLSAEAIAVFKLLFFRPKDLLDLEHLVEVQAGALDVAYVRDQVATIVGEDDERIRRWDAIVTGASSPP